MVFKRLLPIFIIIFLCQHVLNLFAQKPIAPLINNYKSAEQKSRVWLTYSSKFFHHVAENGPYALFDSVLYVSKTGIELASKNDYKALMAYSYFIGYAYKVQIRSDSAFFYLKKSIAYARQNGNLPYEVLAIQQINYLYRYLGKFENTKIYIDRLNALLPIIRDDEVKERILSALSEEYLSNGYYDRAISFILESLPIKERVLAKKKNYASKVSIGLAYASLGNLYLQLNQNKNALNNFKLAYPYFSDYIGGKIRLCANFQQVYLNLKMVDSAMIYYKEIYHSMNNREVYYSSVDLSTANRILASYYLTTDIELAKKYSNLAYSFAVKSENKEVMLYALNLMGNLNYELKKYKEAIFFLEKALPNLYSFSKDVYADINLKLAESYNNIGNVQKGNKFYKEYIVLLKEISKQKTDEEIFKIEFKYKNAQKERQISDLSKKNIIADKLLKQKNQLQVVLIVAFVLVMLIAFLIYINYRNKSSANLLLANKNAQLDILNDELNNANQTKTKLFSIISHDLRSPVSQLFTFLKLQQTNPNVLSEENKQQHQQKLIQSAKQLLATMEDLLIWSKSQMEHFELDVTNVNIPGLFADAITLMQNQADAKNVEIKIGEQVLATLESDENLLTIVLRNLLQNAINNAFPHTTVVLSAGFNAQGNPLIAVSNKGDMIPPEKIAELLANNQIGSKSSGYGLLIVKELLQKINAQLHIESNDKGTTMQVVFNS